MLVRADTWTEFWRTNRKTPDTEGVEKHSRQREQHVQGPSGKGEKKHTHFGSARDSLGWLEHKRWGAGRQEAREQAGEGNRDSCMEGLAGSLDFTLQAMGKRCGKVGEL